jgi:site-specific DNA-methyltransferase (adenine-specific)
MGYVSLGLDVSPYATLLSRVKTTPLLRREVSRIRRWLHGLRKSPPHTDIRRDQSDTIIEAYFPKANFENLLWIRSCIEREFRTNHGIREFLMVGLLAVVEDCSNRKKDGNGLATRPSKVLKPLDVFAAHVDSMLRDMLDLPPSRALSFTHTVSAKKMAMALADVISVHERSLGAIIFSPPYPNSFDYFESYKLELLFGRLFDISSLRASRKELIRNYRQSGKSEPQSDLPTVELLIREIMANVPKKELAIGVRDGRSRLLPNLLRGYFVDMRDVVAAAHCAMPLGTRMHIVVDQSAYVGVPIPTDLLVAEICTQLGFTFEHLTLCRRARTSAQQLRRAPVLGGLLRETVVTVRR